MKPDRDPNAEPPTGARRDVRGGSRDAPATGRLERLRDLDDLEVADGYPDIRGWDVKTADGTKIGEVEDLVVDPRAMRVRYLVVELDAPFRNPTHTASVGEAIRQASRQSGRDEPVDAARPDAGEGHTLIPVGGVRLDDANDEVVVERLTSEQIVGLPRYGGLALTDEYESAVRERLFESGAATAPRGDDYEHEVYDDQRLFAGRRPSPPDRPADAAAADRAGEQIGEQIGEQEIRVPLMREEVVTSKHVVPREEIIVRTHTVTEERTVEADLRRERADVDDAGLAREAPRAPGRSAADDATDPRR